MDDISSIIVKIPRELYDKIEEKISGTSFASVEEYIVSKLKNEFPTEPVYTKEEEDLMVRPPSYYKENRIRLRLGQTVVKADLEDRTLYLKHMEKVHYTRLLLCVGGQPRIPEVHYAYQDHFTVMKTLADARPLRARLSEIQRVLIVGGDLTSVRLTRSSWPSMTSSTAESSASASFNSTRAWVRKLISRSSDLVFTSSSAACRRGMASRLASSSPFMSLALRFKRMISTSDIAPSAASGSDMASSCFMSS